MLKIEIPVYCFQNVTKKGVQLHSVQCTHMLSCCQRFDCCCDIWSQIRLSSVVNEIFWSAIFIVLVVTMLRFIIWGQDFNLVVALPTLTVLHPSRIDLVTWVQRRSRGALGALWGQGVWGIPWGHQVGLMSLQMIHEAYKPVYMWSKFFLRTD